MSMLSVEQVDELKKNQSTNYNKNKKTYYNDLSGLTNIGDQVQVQFVGIKGISDIVAQETHVMHLVSKAGKTYKLYVPCLKDEGTTNSCPLCDPNLRKGKDYGGKETDDSKPSLITPLIMIDLHKQFDSKANGFVDTLKPVATEKGTQLQPVGPQVVKRMNSSKRFRDALIAFVREHKDLTNKVVTIQKIRHIDKDGKPSQTGTPLDNDFAFSINDMIQPVNEADFVVPKVEDLFDPFDEVAMDRYKNTGSFYEPKKTENNASETESVPTASTAAPLPEETPADETDYSAIPGTTFKRRDK